MWKRIVVNGVRIAWIALCCFLLFSALKDYSGHSDWQLEESVYLEMTILCFPSSLVVYLGIVLAGISLGLFGAALPSPSRLEMTCFFLLLAAAGYVQWFILLPRLFRFRAGRPKVVPDADS
jgi:hypothetical protein